MTPLPTKICPPHCNACRLRKTGAFTPVTDGQLKYIEDFRSGTLLVDAGGTLIHEHSPNGKLFALYSGWAFRYKSLSDGRRQILNFCCLVILSACSRSLLTETCTALRL